MVVLGELASHPIDVLGQEVLVIFIMAFDLAPFDPIARSPESDWPSGRS